jgi:SAM-dependent methyltransferase/uncharacterized protein YbaR (Trm112 family)
VKGQEFVPLADIGKIVDLLACPVCHGRLQISSDGEASCQSGNCPKYGSSYKVLAGHPVLIDFTTSAVDEQELWRLEGASSIARGRRASIYRWIRNSAWMDSKNQIAERFVSSRSIWLSTLKERGVPLFVLVVGGGTIGSGLDRLYADPDCTIVAFDIYASEQTQFIADAHQIPVASSSLDLVIVQAVLEHVADPAVVVGEIHRVLKADGIVYSDTPFMQQVHEGRFDFTRFTDLGHQLLFKDFELLEAGASGGAGTSLLWSIDYFFRALLKSNTAGKVARVAFAWLRHADRLLSSRHSRDGASGVYLVGRKSSTPRSFRSITDGYRGAG